MMNDVIKWKARKNWANNGFVMHVGHAGEEGAFFIHKLESGKWDLHHGCNQVALFRTLKAAKYAAFLVAFK